MFFKGTFSVNAWDEKPTHEFGEESKITRATVKQTYSGGATGEGVIEYIMYYEKKMSSRFVGIEYFNGVIGGRSGQMVFEHKGIFEGGVARSEFSTLGGTGELQGFRCKGKFVTTGHAGADYELEVAE